MTECSRYRVCLRRNRWSCGELSGWIGEDREQPWGGDAPAGLLRYLAGMTVEEHHQLVKIAAENLETGYWPGYPSAISGWEEDQPYNDVEREWRAVARHFMGRWAAGDARLTEGLLRFSAYDLVRELASLRGWCPHTA